MTELPRFLWQPDVFCVVGLIFIDLILIFNKKPYKKTPLFLCILILFNLILAYSLVRLLLRF